MINDEQTNLCGDSAPAEYFLNTKLSEQQAHAEFSKIPPNNLKDQKNFTDEIATIKNPTISCVNDKIIQTFDDQQDNQSKRQNIVLTKASTCSEDIPIINHSNNDNDDDNNTNATKLMDLLISSINGSVLSTLELNTIIRKMNMKKADGEIIDQDVPYESCSNMCVPQMSAISMTY